MPRELTEGPRRQRVSVVQNTHYEQNALETEEPVNSIWGERRHLRKSCRVNRLSEGVGSRGDVPEEEQQGWRHGELQVRIYPGNTGGWRGWEARRTGVSIPKVGAGRPSQHTAPIPCRHSTFRSYSMLAKSFCLKLARVGIPGLQTCKGSSPCSGRSLTSPSRLSQNWHQLHSVPSSATVPLFRPQLQLQCQMCLC